MHGIIVIDKPAGITSHDVVARVRRALKTKRVGHTGTLDPFATGVIVILVGNATRLAQFLDKDEKEYEAVVRFGFETDTGDRTGNPTEDIEIPAANLSEKLEKIKWDVVFENFLGEIEQVPPMFSAKKVDGRKLYELARKGVDIERKPVSITIYNLQAVPISPELGQSVRGRRDGTWDMGLTVTCSAGTYIRTLAEDIGRAVGVGAHLAKLRRTRAGRFGTADAITLDELQLLDDPSLVLTSMNEAISHLPEIMLNDDRVAKTRSGLSSRIGEHTLSSGDRVRIVDLKGELIAVGRFDAEENSVQPKIVLG